MAGTRSKVRSGARAMIFAITAEAPKGIPLNIVENWQVNQPHRVETHTGVGSEFPDEIVHHGTSACTASWSRVRTIPAETYQALGILPEHRRLSFHGPCDLVVQDLDRGEVMWHLTDCSPENFSATVGAQTSVRENVSMMCRYLEHASELN